MEELEEGLRNTKRAGSPQEDQQSQLTRTLGDSNTLNHQRASMSWAYTPSPTYVADMQLSLHVGPSTTGAGAVCESAACLWNLFP